MNACKEWELDKTKNPLTKKNIKELGPVYNRISKVCNDPKLCNDFRANNGINPITRKLLKNTSDIKYEFTRLCNNLAGDHSRVIKVKEIKNCDYVSSPTVCTVYNSINLKHHQKNVCEYLMKMGNKLKGILVYHSVGSGKTITAITMIRCLIKQNTNRNIYILAPKSITETFKKEIDKLGLIFGNKLSILTYGTFINIIKRESAEKFRNSILIIDEAHNFKTKVESKDMNNIKYLMSATNIAEKVILLTATPITNSIVDFANLFAMITGNEANLSKLYKIFRDANPEILSRLLRGRVSYYMNDTNSQDYPNVVYNTLEFPMSEEYYQLYKKVEENIQESMGFITSGGTSLTVFLNGVRRAANAIDSQIITDKIKWTVKHIIKQVRENRKVLVYSSWLKSGIRIIQKYLDKYGIKWAEVTGNMSISSRDFSVKRYNRSSVLVMFISSAGGEGLDLKATQSVVILEPYWNSARLDQVIGRAVRYRSHDSLDPKDRVVNIYKLILKKPTSIISNPKEKPSVDVILYKLAEKKNRSIQQFYNILQRSSID